MVRKILFVGEFTKLWNELGIAKSFEKLGIEVSKIPEFNFDHSQAVQEIERFKPDLVLYAKLKIPDPAGFIRFVKSKGIPTASWTFDLYFGLRREARLGDDPIFKSDYVFGPDGGHEKEFREKGINYRVLRQGIYDEFCYLSKDKSPSSDIVFTGVKNAQWPYRNVLCKFLVENYDFKWYGRELKNRDIRGHDLNILYANAKIVIGDSFYSPRYWSNRIYETLGRGGFLIHPLIEGLEEEYVPYKHFIPYPFSNFDKLKEKIDYFLPREEERKKIALAGMEHTKNNHTLVHRCKEFLGKL